MALGGGAANSISRARRRSASTSRSTMPRWKSFVTDGATHPESDGNNVIIKREFSPTATCSNCLSSQSDGKAVTGTPRFYPASSQSLDATFPQSADSVPSQPPTLVRKMVSKATKMVHNHQQMLQNDRNPKRTQGAQNMKL